MTRPLRLLVVHRGLLHQRDDTLEIDQQVLGIIEVGGARVEPWASDGHSLFRVEVREGAICYAYGGRFPWRRAHGFDVAYVHMPVPLVHLLVAARLRVAATKIVFAPMAMLEDGYGRSGWFRRLSLGARVAKWLTVRVLRRAWLAVSHRFVCLSREEVMHTSLPPDRCLIVPWAAPASGLGAAAASAPTERGEASERSPVTDRPAVVICRFDAHRKGLDRLGHWLVEHEASLPRPAAVLLAPPHPEPPPELGAAIELGLLTWDQDTMGPGLLEPLLASRGSILLSRWEAQARALRESLLLGRSVVTTSPSHLAEVAELAGGVEVVDGDDPAAVQHAFERLGKDPVDVATARWIFDRRRIGAFLVAAFEDEARGHPPATDGYALASEHAFDDPRSEAREEEPCPV
jgi:hypothetical protein